MNNFAPCGTNLETGLWPVTSLSGSLQTHSLVRTAAGGDAVLACHSSNHPSHVEMVEWTWLHSIPPKTVYAVRNGKELVKDQAPEYRGRSSLMGDGSLNLSKVQPQDSGCYRSVRSTRCFLLCIAEQRAPSNAEVLLGAESAVFTYQPPNDCIIDSSSAGSR